MPVDYLIKNINSLESTFLEFMLSSYSEEELIILKNLCDPYHYYTYINYPITVHVPPLTLYLETPIKDDIVSILNKPLESMPLLINDYTDVRLSFVKWRLTIAR